MIGKFIPIEGDESLSYRKEFNVKTMKAHGANGYVGLREDDEAYHVYTKYWKFEPAWNGEGLPPVGIECEREVPRGWSRCRINYVSSSLIVYQMMDSGNEHASTLTAFKFRPIRTEAERNREAAIAEMASTTKPCGHAIYDICAQLYDAGYRKAEVTDD